MVGSLVIFCRVELVSKKFGVEYIHIYIFFFDITCMYMYGHNLVTHSFLYPISVLLVFCESDFVAPVATQALAHLPTF